MTNAQISLPQPIYDELQLRAKKAGKKADELAREFVVRGLRSKRQPSLPRKPLDELVNLKFQGPPDLSRNIDHYLYDN